MKPFSSIQKNRRTGDGSFPVVDCNYHSLGFGDFNTRCAKIQRPSFSTISRDYFAAEAPSNFVIESVVFGVIALAAVPAIVDCARALFEFVRAIGVA